MDATACLKESKRGFFLSFFSFFKRSNGSNVPFVSLDALNSAGRATADAFLTKIKRKAEVSGVRTEGRCDAPSDSCIMRQDVCH